MERYINLETRGVTVVNYDEFLPQMSEEVS